MANKDFDIHSGLKAPDDYFDKFKHNILEISMLEEYKSKENPLKIPTNYFEKSKKRILNATIGSATKVRTLLRYAVASAVFVAFISSVWIFFSKNTTENPQFSDLTSTEIQNYMEKVYLEDKSYFILEQLNDANFEFSVVNELQNSTEIEDFLSDYEHNLDINY